MSNYEIITESVKGFHNINQDYISTNKEQDNISLKDKNIIVFLSDGHGSERYYKSHIGSKLATEISVEIFKNIGDIDNMEKEKIEPKMKEKCDEIVDKWKEAVTQDYAKDTEQQKNEKWTERIENLINYILKNLQEFIKPNIKKEWHKAFEKWESYILKNLQKTIKNKIHKTIYNQQTKEEWHKTFERWTEYIFKKQKEFIELEMKEKLYEIIEEYKEAILESYKKNTDKQIIEIWYKIIDKCKKAISESYKDDIKKNRKEIWDEIDKEINKQKEIILEEYKKETEENIKNFKYNFKNRKEKKLIKKWKESFEKFDEIVKEWKNKNSENIKNEIKKELNKILKLIYVYYGATLLGVVITQKYIISFQLGDGDILQVKEDKSNNFEDRKYNVNKLISPPPDFNIGDETESLCMEEAKELVIVQIIDNDPNTKLIMLSTDGYSKSFTTYDGFLQAGEDFMTLYEDEKEAIKNNLKSWLEETSKEGSGDDITVGLIFKND